MANRTTSNPVYFDQFNADTVLAKQGESFIVTKIRYKSVADGDIFRLDDANGNIIFEDIQTSAGDWREVNFNDGGFNFNDGVTIDVSDCTGMAATDGTDCVYIYLK